MRISCNWLNDYLPLKIPSCRLAEILTGIGLEVENLEEIGQLRGGLEGLVIGQVLEVGPHPNAQKLKLIRVDTGNHAAVQIVCGAPNVSQGQKVVVALPGSTIYPLHGDPLTLKVARIRGEDSFGMICAEDEIGLGESHAGIIVLNDSALVGSPVKDYYRLYTDQVLEIGLTPNRVSAMSHMGVAKEVCTFLNTKAEGHHHIIQPNTDSFQPDNLDHPFSIQIKDSKACLRYAGLSISGVTLGESPAWLTDRLKAVGVRSVNNLVDITNYVMHECGQPLHVFDADKIEGRSIIVRTLPPGTPFTTLDGVPRKLDGEDLMICDNHSPLCLAGVFGGLNSGVNKDTVNLFLESAWFDPARIRRTSLRHGLRTDSALRFEKGADISGIPYALKRAALLIKELAGGKISSGITDVYPVHMPKTEVTVTLEYINSVSGMHHEFRKINQILTDLDFEVSSNYNNYYTPPNSHILIIDEVSESRESSREDPVELHLKVPYHSPDISSPPDIAEEIMRMVGYDQVEIPSRVSFVPIPGNGITRQAIQNRVADYLVANGFYEILTNSISHSKLFGEQQQSSLIRLANTLSAELDTLRPSMLESGLQSIAYNLNRKNGELQLFEFGKIYFKESGQYIEQAQLCLYLTGKGIESWAGIRQKPDIYLLKGILMNLCYQLGLGKLFLQPADHAHLSGVQRVSSEGRQRGIFGQVRQDKLAQFDIRQDVWYASLQWDQICEGALQSGLRIRPVSKFPAVRRDLSLILDRQVQYAEVEDAINRLKSPQLMQMQLFDVFESEKLGAGKKSYAISLTFQDEEKTLTEPEIDRLMQQVTGALAQQLQAEVRK